MIKLGNKGFAGVSILITVLVVACIGATGYYVYDSNKNTGIDEPASTVEPETSQNDMAEVSYNNNVGDSFKLLFYKNYQLTSAPVGGNKSETTRNGKGLTSNVSYNQRAPYWFFIASQAVQTTESGKRQVESAKQCVSNGFSKVFTTENTHVGQQINVCNPSRSNGAKAPMYVAVFSYKDRDYFVTVLSSASGDQSSAKADLEAYNTDLHKVISSIQIEETR